MEGGQGTGPGPYTRKLKYGKTFNTGNYENERVEVEIELDEDELIEHAYIRLRDKVTQMREYPMAVKDALDRGDVGYLERHNLLRLLDGWQRPEGSRPTIVAYGDDAHDCTHVNVQIRGEDKYCLGCGELVGKVEVQS